MANYNELKTAIRQVVRANDNQEITGSNLQEVLLSMVSSLGDNFQFAGIAIPSTNPGTPDQNVFYIAGPGSYVNFGNYTVPGGSIGIFTYDGSWDKQSIDIAESLRASVGYFVCDTAAATAAKTIAATGYALATGGNIRIKMTNANTADAVTLNINNTGAKALYYNGAQASSTNSWLAEEIVEVYYDGTQYNAIGNKANAIKYDNLNSNIKGTNVQTALDAVSEVVGNTDYLETLSSRQVVDLNNLQVVNLFVGPTDWLYHNDGSESFIIDAREISVIQITASDTLCPVFLLKSTEISQGTADLCYNEIGRRTISANTTTLIRLPKDCVAVGIGKNWRGVSYTPSNITIFPSTRKALSELLVCKNGINKIVSLERGGWNYETGAPITNTRFARTRGYIDLSDVYGIQMIISSDVDFGSPASVRILKYHDDILVGYLLFDFTGATALITLLKDTSFNKIKAVIYGSSTFPSRPRAIITCKEIISNSDVCNALPSALEKLKNNISISNYSDTGFFEFIGYNTDDGLPMWNGKLASSSSIFVHGIFKATLNLPITIDSIVVLKYHDAEYVGYETFDSNSLSLNVDYSFNRVIIRLYYDAGFTDEIVSECSYSYITGSLNTDEEHNDDKSVKDKEIDYVKSLQTKTRILTLEEQEMVPTTGVNIRYYNGHLLLTVDGVESEIGVSEVEHFPFEGKRISFMGDSITTFSDYPGSYNSFYTGSNAGVTSVEDTWWGGLCSALHSSINRIYSYGGGKISDICSNYDKLFSNGSSGVSPDFIFVLVGINDWAHNTTIGAITDLEGINTTFYGSYKYLLSHLRETYPDAQIITLTLLNSMYLGTNFPFENNNGKAIKDYNNAIKECSDFYSVPCLELNKLVNINGFNYTTYLEDLTHPKKVGMEIITKAIKNNIYNLTTV